jgi:hypothetical protein
MCHFRHSPVTGFAAGPNIPLSNLIHLTNALRGQVLNHIHIESPNVSQFKYLKITVTNQNLIQEEIMRRLTSDNACYRSVQNFLIVQSAF